jgi:hypothetical protein
MHRPLPAFCTLLLATLAGLLAFTAHALAADDVDAAIDDIDVAALMDETAVAVASIDVSTKEPGDTFAELTFGGPWVPAHPGDWPGVFQKLLTGAGVRHVLLILQAPRRQSPIHQQSAVEAVCVVPFDTPQAAKKFAAPAMLYLEGAAWHVATRGRYCVFGTQELLASALAKDHPPRPEIAPALAAAGDAPLAIVFAPSPDQRRVLAALLPALPAEQGGKLLRAWANEAQWTTAAYDPGKSFRLIVQAASPPAAVALAGSLDGFLKNTAANVRAINGVPVPFGPMLAVLEQRVDGEQLTLSVDLQKLPPADNVFEQATGSAMAAVRRRQAMQQFKEIGVALHNHHDVKKRFPDAAIRDDAGKPLLSWRVRILPYLGEDALYREFHLNEPWDSEHNQKLIERMPAAYRLSKQLPPGKTNIVLPIGAETAWPEGRGRPIREFIDGTSKTITVVEADDAHAVTWTEPVDHTYDPAHPAAGLGNHFGPGFVSGSADASAHYLPLDTNPDTLRMLFTPAGKEPVSWPGQ